VKVKILIVDDQKDSRDLLYDLLAMEGYQVEQATDGEKAFKAVQDNIPDMIITDILMPNMDGLTLCQKIKSNNLLKKIPVIIYSATFVDEQDKQLALDLGASSFLVKPMEPDVFLKEMDKVIVACQEHPMTSAKTEYNEKTLSKRLDSRLSSKLTEKVAELDEYRRSLATLMSNLPGMVYQCLNDDYWTMKFVSEGCLTLTGFRPESLIDNRDMSYSVIVHPEDKTRIRQEIQVAIEKGESFQLEYRILRGNQKERWIWEQGRCVSPPGVTPVVLEGYMTDITEQKRAQAERNLSEERLRLALSNAQVGLWDWDIKLNSIFYSSEWAKMIGLEQKDLDNTLDTWSSRVHPDDLPGAMKKVERCLSNPELPYKSVFQFHHNNGDYIWVMARGKILVDEQGEASRFIGTHVDITSEKETEESLHKLAHAVEQSHESIVITNLDAEIEYVNDTFVQHTGYPKEEVMGCNPRILSSGNTPPENYQSMWKSLKQGHAWQGEFYNRKKDGSEFIEFASISPVYQADGSISNYIAVKEDITEKKRLENELEKHRHHLEELIEERTAQLVEARELAEAANIAKSTFLANMSHEIRTPMNGVLGMTHLALQTNLNDKQKHYIKRAHQSAESLLGIINDILDFSKIEAGKLEIESIDFDIGDVIRNMVNLLQLKASEKGVKLSVKLAPEVPRELIGDPLRLSQVFINLVNNAIKFSHSGDNVTLTISLKEEINSDVVLLISVQDTGIGISFEQQEKLFQSFSQADASTVRQYGGTGLGLVICKKIVQMMKGEIWVESEPDIGSTFSFTAQLERQQEQSIANQIPGDTENRQSIQHLLGTKILLVEDNEINQEVATELLTDIGVQLVIANNGTEALAMINQYAFDGVLMDCMMPVMDGYETTLKIRDQEQFKDLPIIAMTASAMKQDIEKALSVGMNDHIAKPINPDAIFHTMAKWIHPKTRISNRNKERHHSEALLKQKLSGLYGVVTDSSSLSSNPKLLKKMLLKFCDQNGDFEQRFRTAIADQRLEIAIYEAHTIKGSAGTLGLLTVQQAALELEMACKENQKDIEVLLQKLLIELNRVIEGINVLK